MFKLIGMFLIVMALSGCQSLSLDNPLRNAEPPVFLKVEQLLSKGELAYKNGRLDVAEQAFLEVVQLDPRDEQANYRLGNIYFRKGDLKKSAVYLSTVISVNPKNAKAHYNLGTIHLMFAEKHMKFFAATAPRDFDISNVSTLLGDLDAFSNGGDKKQPISSVPPSNNLDNLVNLIEKN